MWYILFERAGYSPKLTGGRAAKEITMSTNESLSIPNGKVFPYEIIRLSVGRYSTLKSFRDQLNADGISKINERRVQELEKSLWAALNAPQNIPLLNSKDEVLQSNHRLVATKRNQLMPNRLDPSLEFYVARLTVPTTAAEDAELAIRGNLDTNTENYRTHLYDSSLDISKKVVKPVYDAVKLAWPEVTPGILNQVVPRLAAYLNQNTAMVSKLSGPIPVAAYDFSYARRYPEANAKFFEAETYVDLRPYVNEIAESITLGLKVIADLQKEGVWKEKFGKRKTNLTYILVALSMRGQISVRDRKKGELTIGKITTAVKNSSARIVNALKKFNNASKAKEAEDTILLIFQEHIDSI